MNELNYASLEASKRLVDAGIVLETDFKWYQYDSATLQSLIDGGKMIPQSYLVTKESIIKDCRHWIPAPSMAEVWRELPESIEWNDSWHHLTVEKLGDKTSCYYRTNGKDCDNINPTDALIDLLIWVTEQKRKEKV